MPKRLWWVVYTDGKVAGVVTETSLERATQTVSQAYLGQGVKIALVPAEDVRDDFLFAAVIHLLVTLQQLVQWAASIRPVKPVS